MSPPAYTPQQTPVTEQLVEGCFSSVHLVFLGEKERFQKLSCPALKADTTELYFICRGTVASALTHPY